MKMPPGVPMKHQERAWTSPSGTRPTSSRRRSNETSVSPQGAWHRRRQDGCPDERTGPGGLRGKLPAATAPVAKAPAAAPAQPAIPSNPMKEAYFGETHLHTAYSLDAYLGGTRLTPAMPIALPGRGDGG